VKKQIIKALNSADHRAELASATVASAAALSEPMAEEGVGGSDVKKLKAEISTRVKQEPLSASRLVQSWLREEGS
jgi:hypothetical protein